MVLTILTFFVNRRAAAINEGQLNLCEMQADKTTFPVNTIDLQHAKVLIRRDGEEVVEDKRCKREGLIVRYSR